MIAFYKQTLLANNPTGGGTWHTTYDTMKHIHQTQFTQDMTINRKHLDAMNYWSQQLVSPSKGQVKGGESKKYTKRLEEIAKKNNLTPDRLEEMLFVHGNQGSFHKRRAEQHMEMAYKNAALALESGTMLGQTPDLISTPSLFDKKPDGDHTIKEALDFHTAGLRDAVMTAEALAKDLQVAESTYFGLSNQLPGPGEVPRQVDDSAVLKTESANMNDLSILREKKDVLYNSYNHMMNMAELHADSISNYSDFIKRKTDKDPNIDRGPNYDPELDRPGIDSDTPVSNANIYPI